MFQGPESDVAKPSSRVLKPPGGCSSNVFGSPEEVSVPLKPRKATSNIFGGGEEPQAFAKKTNPPGGKESGIFEDHKPNALRQLANPPGGKTSNIFGSPQPFSTVKAHPNKPKDHTVILDDRGDSRKELKTKAPEDPKPRVEVVREVVEAPKESPKVPGPKMDDHEPRLGPRPRSHNKVLNPPGGKSSIAFY
ncbi:jupiter microtubule associated homolog 2 [Anolis carolinensis]|uniref:Jupiter microtubule associated homolog 2 n=1 Tax=Anolis carolinensis TaxID=28377 RepID=H9G775_ANOCA|nr:PREDICTED: hematological and neurological expressed 1-like protein [Anolis carolinensis]|eukprot:XP_008120328.1 PREDICTED: hematological and neurological expressed 1-like protein [Anolis carolinensis]